MNQTLRKKWIGLTLALTIAYGGCLLGVPRFQRFQGRSLQTEGKILLASLYTAEQSFRSESGRFSPDLTELQFVPEGTPRYVVGFSEKCRQKDGLALNTLQIAGGNHPDAFRLSEAARENIRKTFAELPCPARFPENWEAYAVGDLGEKQLDIWKITNTRELTLVQSGAPEKPRHGRIADILVLLATLAALATLAWISLKILQRPATRIAKGVLVLALGLLTILLFSVGVATQTAYKPVIHLYPPTERNVFVGLDFQGQLTFTYPAYQADLGGWEVRARPDGTLFGKQGQEYQYLFWEGDFAKPLSPRVSEGSEEDSEEGFVFSGDQTVPFLREVLPRLGLQPREYNDFITFWGPRLERNPFNFVYFAGAEYASRAPLRIFPTPDTVIRVFAVFKPLARPMPGLRPQSLAAPQRRGFTVVEWGGTLLER